MGVLTHIFCLIGRKNVRHLQFPMGPYMPLGMFFDISMSWVTNLFLVFY